MTEGEDLQLGLRSIGTELETLMRRTFGRDLEFVVIVFDRLPGRAEMPVGYLCHTKTNMQEALQVAHGSLTEIIKPLPPSHPINLH